MILEDFKKLLNNVGNFHLVMRNACEHLPTTVKELANKYEVSISTIEKWINGSVSPHPQIQEVIFNDFRNMMILSKKNEDSWNMYVVVNNSLNMSPGKLAAQVGHAVEMYLCNIFGEIDNFTSHLLMEELRNWKNNGSAKIILKANEKEWKKLINMDWDKFVIQDEGRTEVPEGSYTVIGFRPMLKSSAPKILRKLQLY